MSNTFLVVIASTLVGTTGLFVGAFVHWLPGIVLILGAIAIPCFLPRLR